MHEGCAFRVDAPQGFVQRRVRCTIQSACRAHRRHLTEAPDGAVPGAPHRGVPRSKPCEGLPAILQPVGSKGAHVDVGLVSQTFYRALPGVLYEGVPGASYAIVSGAPYGAAPGKSYGPWQSWHTVGTPELRRSWHTVADTASA